MTGTKTGKAKPLVHQATKDVKFPTGSMCLVEGRDDEGVFRVVSTGEWSKGGHRTVKGYMEDGGKIAWLDEGSLRMAPR